MSGRLGSVPAAVELANGTSVGAHAASVLNRLQGRSPSIEAVRAQLSCVATRVGPVLLQGASGTGKEVAARIVHDLSPRSAHGFVALDCGSCSESLLESELFGHARGAFTSAHAERRGLFEEADGGTLFLDEIANTSLAFQARLLRALQEGEVRRVGANHTRRVDVRIVTASNRDLWDEVRHGRFREDLLYRLDVFRVRLPSLAQRREDVPALAASLLAELRHDGSEAPSLSPAALGALVAWHWPGNVRELRNVLQSATAYAVDGHVELDHLPERLRPRRGRHSRPETLRELLGACERALLRERLEAHGWNRTRAARALGITRRCLFNKIARHGLRPD